MIRKILICILVALVITTVAYSQLSTAIVDERTNTPEKLGIIWENFINQSNGRYCFFLSGKDCPNGHEGYLFITIKNSKYKLEQGGILCPGNNTYYYSEELHGLRKSDKITATYKSKTKTNFTIGERSLMANHFMTEEIVTYVLEECRDTK